MKTAAKVLGIVGGALAIIFSLWMVLGLWIANSYVGQTGVLDEAIQEAQDQLQDDLHGQEIPGMENFSGSFPNFFTNVYNLSMGIVLIFGIIGLLGGACGLVGGLLVNKNNILAGVLMLVGGVLTFSGCFTFIILVLGGIFALVKGKENPSPVVQ